MSELLLCVRGWYPAGQAGVIVGGKLSCAPVLGCALAVGVFVSACGGSSQPGASTGNAASTGAASTSDTVKQIIPAMDAAVAAAQSVHMTGSAMSGSQRITFNMSFYGRSDMSGRFHEDGASLSILAVGGKTYIELDAAFLKLQHAPTAVCAIMCGKYVELSASQSSQLTSTLTMSALSKQAFGKLPSSVTGDTSALFVPASYDGEAVLSFHGGGDTIDVAANGAPYPVLFTDAKGDVIVFTEWNSVSAPTPPPASDTVNLSQLEQ